MFEETMFIRATGARLTRRAQANAEVFSGNSERNGATHWMKTNWDIPRLTASDSMDFRNGSAIRAMTTPPPKRRRPTAPQRFHPSWERAQREIGGTSSFSSTVSGRGGRRRRIQRYVTYVAARTAESTSDRLALSQITTK